MSLDVYLVGAPSRGPGTGIFIREGGVTREITREEWDALCPGREPVVAHNEPENVYTRNITHNLAPMAEAAGLYLHLWRPDEIGVAWAGDLVEPLLDGLKRLRADPERYRALNPENGWGTYEGLVAFVAEYLEACRCNPNAAVLVSR